jgi:fermentation-respiration switch protein FrsA (DUF1100 family)
MRGSWVVRLLGGALVVLVALAGCGSSGDTPGGNAAAEVTPDVAPIGDPGTSPAATDQPSVAARPAPVTAPTKAFAVGTRQLNLSRGADRPLRTVVLYPANGTAGGNPKANATPAAGRFPLVIFSHGLTGSPEGYQSITTKIAAAGFIVAAPAYPFTSAGVKKFDASDMGNQPADASVVITEVLKLNGKAGDPLAGHLDSTRVAASGHSAGGYTTAGMLSGSTRDARLSAGIIVSGGAMNGKFAGAATPVLFIHGDKDAVVPYATGRGAYDKLTWPKAFLTVLGGDHGPLFGAPATPSIKTMIDFLRWALYGDAAAKSRLPGDATVAGSTTFESSL